MNTNQAKNWQKKHAEEVTTQRKRQVIVKTVKTGWVTKGEKFLYALFAVIVITAAYFIISFSSSTDQLNRELQTLESQVNQKVVSNDTLNFEVKELSKPERITQIAKENGLKIQDAQVKRAVKSND